MKSYKDAIIYSLAAISIIGSLVFVTYLDIEMSEEEQRSIQQRFEPALAEYKAVSLDSAPGTNQRRHSGQIVVINGDTGQLSRMQFENFRFGILHSRPEGFIATRPEDAKTSEIARAGLQSDAATSGGRLLCDC